METTSFTYKTGPCSDVLIIGGGLAGMYSALAAAESGAAVRILCKSKTGGSGNSVAKRSQNVSPASASSRVSGKSALPQCFIFLPPGDRGPVRHRACPVRQG